MIPTGKYRIPIVERTAETDKQRLFIGIPMTGLLRAEWVLARYGQIMPCNWSSMEFGRVVDQYSPLRFTVADARNIIATQAVEKETEWVWFIDHDVVLPPLATVMINEYMVRKTHPIVAGLYFTKGVPSEPLVYRGRGTGYYADWKMGDVVTCDGHGMGCTLIHTSILKAVYAESESYTIENMPVRRIFTTPNYIVYDPKANIFTLKSGTEDLEFLTRLMKNDIFKKAGWPKFQKKKWPCIVDTNLFCKHIEFDGKMYPIMGEEQKFAKRRPA